MAAGTGLPPLLLRYYRTAGATPLAEQAAALHDFTEWAESSA